LLGELWFDSRKRQRDSSLQIVHTDCEVYSVSCSLDTGDCALVRGLVGMWPGSLKLTTTHPYLLLSFRSAWFYVYCSTTPPQPLPHHPSTFRHAHFHFVTSIFLCLPEVFMLQQLKCGAGEEWGRSVSPIV
jgi:hypothetical protein